MDETVHCARCDELLIKMFMHDHTCDETKLNGMISNSRGQMAEPLVSDYDGDGGNEEGPAANFSSNVG